MANPLNYSWFDALTTYKHRAIHPLTSSVARVAEKRIVGACALVAALLAQGKLSVEDVTRNFLAIAYEEFGYHFTQGFLDAMLGNPADFERRFDTNYMDGHVCGRQAVFKTRQLIAQRELTLSPDIVKASSVVTAHR